MKRKEWRKIMINGRLQNERYEEDDEEEEDKKQMKKMTEKEVG